MERASKSIGELSPSIFEATIPSEYRPDMVKQYVKNRFKAVLASGGVSSLRREFTDPLWILLAITGSVLPIACANLANLLLARASVREREIAARQAVGASRPRLIGQFLIESLLLAAAGSAIGLGVAQILSRSLVAFLNSDGNSVAVPTGLNWHLFAFLAGLAVVTCFLFGLAPALRASSADPAAAMHGVRTSTSSRERNGLRRTLVTTQVALSLILLVAALLFGRSLQNLLAVNLGFNAQNILVVNATAIGPGFDKPEKRTILFRELNERIHALGGVASVAEVAISPFSGFGWNQLVHADDDASRTGGKVSWFNRAGPDYFATMRTRLLAGRDFNAHDDLSGPKVALVNQSFAKTLFKGQNPVGRSIRVEEEEGKPDNIYQVVGVIALGRYNDLREAEPNIVFLPLAQDPQPGSTITFVIRGRERLDSLESAVQREITQVSPDFLVDFHVLAVQIEDSVLRERLMANLGIAFGMLASCLSALGLYGVMSYAVARRRNEIGIRLALGATRGNVYTLIAKDAMIMVVTGLTIGIVASLILSFRAMPNLFFLACKGAIRSR